MTTTLTFYGYDKCDSCRKARKLLESLGATLRVIDITTAPPSKALLGKLLRASDYSLKQLWNRSGQEYRRLELKTRAPAMTQAEALELLASNGRLLKRPIVTDGARFCVGFDAERLRALATG